MKKIYSIYECSVVSTIFKDSVVHDEILDNLEFDFSSTISDVDILDVQVESFTPNTARKKEDDTFMFYFKVKCSVTLCYDANYDEDQSLKNVLGSLWCKFEMNPKIGVLESCLIENYSVSDVK
jgi:hypothetical protein